MNPRSPAKPAMSRKISIGTTQPIFLKWASLLLLAGGGALLVPSFGWPFHPGHGGGPAFLVAMVACLCLRALTTANVYVQGPHFVIEHALRGTCRKDAALFRGVETSPFWAPRIVFADGTSYSFRAGSSGSGPAAPQDHDAYAAYVRGLLGE